jgi:flagellar FliJ protein
MKGYKYKLEALLKIRKLKEERCKMEIGRLQVHIRDIEKQIEKHSAGIDEAYDLQEQSLEKGIEGLEVRFHPYFVQGKRSHIEALTNEKARVEHYVQQKFVQLAQLRANVKVLEKMKEKDKKAYKKQIEKKQNERIEEQVQNWRMILGKEA